MDEDVKLALLRLCAKGERFLDVATFLLAAEGEKHFGMSPKWERVVEESGLQGEEKEKLRAIVQQVLKEKGGPV